MMRYQNLNFSLLILFFKVILWHFESIFSMKCLYDSNVWYLNYILSFFSGKRKEKIASRYPHLEESVVSDIRCINLVMLNSLNIRFMISC